jgi:hypothetical protein
MLAPCLQKADIQRQKPRLTQCWGHVPAGDPEREALDHRGLADACLAGQDRVVLPPPHQDVDNLANLGVSPDDRVDLAVACLFGHVGAELRKRLFLTHRGRRHRARSLARRGSGAGARTVLRHHRLLRRARSGCREFVCQRIGLDLLELARDVVKDPAKRRRLQHTEQQMPGAHLTRIVEQRAPDPGPLHRVLQMIRQIADRTRAARQRIERARHVGGDAAGVELEMTDDPVHGIAVMVLQDLVQPVHDLDIRIAAQLAEHGRPLHRFVAEGIQLAEQFHATDIAHLAVSLTGGAAGSGRCRRSTWGGAR